MMKVAHVLLLSLLLFPVSAYAQETPKDFFQRGYASDGGVGKEVVPLVKKKKSKEKAKDDSKSGILKDSESSSPLQAKQHSVVAPSILLDDEGVPVHSIGLIVDGQNKVHFQKHLETLIDTASRFELLVTQVAAIGLMLPGKEGINIGEFMHSPHAFSLMALEGQLAPYAALPEKIAHIERSPTWVINTAQGAVLVEGLEKIWTLFNKKGEFLGLNENLPALQAKQQDMLRELEHKDLSKETLSPL